MDNRPTKTALVLSAGAPHSPLMAGALCAFYEAGKTFDIIYTSGAGALIGLLFIAPKGKSPDEALRGLVDIGISDAIYRLLPINYKVFQKPGPFTRPIQRWANLFKVGRVSLSPIANPASALGRWYNAGIEARNERQDGGDGEVRRLYNDLIDMWAAAITPTTLNYKSQGLCEPLPFLEDLIDFAKLRNFDGKFFLNAFNPDAALGLPAEGRSGSGKGIELFDEDEITPMHVRAAFAYPFIYTPVKIGGRRYFEGANRDPISFGNLLTNEKVQKDDIKTLVLVDILAGLARHLLREPRDLWDAFGLSIMVPVVAHAQKELARFKKKYKAGEFPFEYLKVKFTIDDVVGSRITEWSYSNLSTLFEIGRQAGLEFCRQHGRKLPNRRETAADAIAVPNIVDDLTRESYPRRRYRGRCTEAGCDEEAKEHDSVNHLRGWFERHIERTGHRVVIEEIDWIGRRTSI